jgi:hypothetical protein
MTNAVILPFPDQTVAKEYTFRRIATDIDQNPDYVDLSEEAGLEGQQEFKKAQSS